MDQTVKDRLARIYNLTKLVSSGSASAAEKAELARLKGEQISWEAVNPGMREAVAKYMEKAEYNIGFDRAAKIKVLTTKGSAATDAEKAELKKLLGEQGEWVKANPKESVEVLKAFAVKPEAEARVEYDAAMAEASAKGLKLDPEASAAARKEMVLGGVPGSVLPIKVTPPSEFTTEQEQARTDYGNSIRDQAIASGTPVATATAMGQDAYSSWYPEMFPEKKIDPAVKTDLEADDYAWGEPYTEAPKTEAPKAEIAKTEAPKAEVITPELEKQKGKIPWDKLGKVGIGFLHLAEAVGKQRGRMENKTTLGEMYQKKLADEQNKYMKQLEEAAAVAEAKRKDKQLQDQRSWESGENALDRTAAAARAAAAATGGVSAGLIPS